MSYYENLLNQITVCPRCQGFGFLPLPPQAKNPKPCPECNNAGVFLVKPDQILLFSLPTFLDSKKRSQISLFKKILLVSTLSIILLTFLIINSQLSIIN